MSQPAVPSASLPLPILPPPPAVPPPAVPLGSDVSRPDTASSDGSDSDVADCVPASADVATRTAAALNIKAADLSLLCHYYFGPKVARTLTTKPKMAEALVQRAVPIPFRQNAEQYWSRLVEDKDGKEEQRADPDYEPDRSEAQHQNVQAEGDEDQRPDVDAGLTALRAELQASEQRLQESVMQRVEAVMDSIHYGVE